MLTYFAIGLVLALMGTTYTETFTSSYEMDGQTHTYTIEVRYDYRGEIIEAKRTYDGIGIQLDHFE